MAPVSTNAKSYTLQTLTEKQRNHALPQATTESAREARKAFFCELCQKGYARMNEFEAHESSYDHQHRKRLKEMKQLSKDSSGSVKARTAEDSSKEMTAVPLASISLGSVRKKPVFLSTGPTQGSTSSQAHDNALAKKPSQNVTESRSSEKDDSFNDLDNALLEGDEYDSDDPDGAQANGWIHDRYDPLVYSNSDHRIFLDGRGRECADACRFCKSPRPLSMLNPREEWTQEKQDELVASLHSTE